MFSYLASNITPPNNDFQVFVYGTAVTNGPLRMGDDILVKEPTLEGKEHLCRVVHARVNGVKGCIEYLVDKVPVEEKVISASFIKDNNRINPTGLYHEVGLELEGVDDMIIITVKKNEETMIDEVFLSYTTMDPMRTLGLLEYAKTIANETFV
jgi:hypothetical protein